MHSILERIAPYTPPEDLEPGEVDDRTFVERLHDADNRRAENPNTRVATSYNRPWYLEVDTGWSATHWGLGIDAEWTHGGPKGRMHGSPSMAFLTLTIGPWSIGARAEWNYPEKRY